MESYCYVGKSMSLTIWNCENKSPKHITTLQQQDTLEDGKHMNSYSETTGGLECPTSPKPTWMDAQSANPPRTLPTPPRRPSFPQKLPEVPGNTSPQISSRTSLRSEDLIPST